MTTRHIAVFAITHPWMQEMIRQVDPPDFEVKFLDMNNPAEVQSLLPQADFLVGGRLMPEQLSLLKRCKLIQSQGVGYDSVDVDALAAAGIPFALTPEGTVIGVAEHTILLILALYKLL